MKRTPTLHAGKKLGRYVIERELGRGGMGIVYVAIDENTERQVALKTTSIAQLGTGPTSRGQRRQRFIREVQALSQVNHENVVHVFDAGEADDPDLGWLLYYSMDYVEGLTLAQLVQEQGALHPDAAAAVCMHVAAGLGAAHARGIVHRDVKPANIFLSLDGRALIGDFGICKIEGGTQITRRDQLVGTPNYLAPEQILGEDVTPATDVFALGALYYVIACNRPLRDKVDASSLLESAQSDAPKLRMLAEESVPADLRAVLAKALERDPRDRYVDGAALAEALSDHASRVPSLVGHMRAPPTPESSAEQSSPFAQLPDVSASDVEALDDVSSEIDTRTIDQKARALMKRSVLDVAAADAHALPQARTESTVMFKLRTLDKPPAPPVQPVQPVLPAPVDVTALPAVTSSIASPLLAPEKPRPAAVLVATSESTLVFKLKKEAEAALHAQAALHALSAQSAASAQTTWATDPSMAAPMTLSEPSGPSTSQGDSELPFLSSPDTAVTSMEALPSPLSNPSVSMVEQGWPSPARGPRVEVPTVPVPPPGLGDDDDRHALSNPFLDGPTPVADGIHAAETRPDLRAPLSLHERETAVHEFTQRVPHATDVAADATVVRRAPLPRAAWVALVAAFGAVCALAGVSVWSSTSSSTPEPRAVPVVAAAPAAPVKPALPPPCAAAEAPRASDKDRSRAQTLVEQAQELRQRSDSPDKIVGKVRAALALDGRNVDAQWLLGRLTEGAEQAQADACVCRLAADDKRCADLKRARGP
jgi:serine/threonine protein kinase